jgi:IS5 family transposase
VPSRTILGSLLREIRRKGAALAQEDQDSLSLWLQRADRIHGQRPKDRNKHYALHAPEVECIGKGKTRQPYEFGVKGCLAGPHKSGLIVGAQQLPRQPLRRAHPGAAAGANQHAAAGHRRQANNGHRRSGLPRR